jgi:hypothetical protein
MASLTIPYNWRPALHQIGLYNSFGYGKKFQRGCAVWHRRAGKDSTALNLTAREMFGRVGSYWHLFPEQTQARRAVWNGIDREGRRIIDQFLPPEVRKRKSDQEMLIEVSNGSIWQMAGSDNFDSLVGSNPVGVVFSEWSLANPEAWEYIRPILVENGGWALFIYTPRGKNHGHQTYVNAIGDPGWFCERLTVDDTGLISPEVIDAERRAGMAESKIRQEFYCSFEADNDDQFIGYDVVRDARKRAVSAEPWGERVMGVDVARFGDDKSVIYFRTGRDGRSGPGPIEGAYERYAGMNTMELASRVADWIHRFRPDAVFVDDGGVGGGVVDRLHQLGFRFVKGVNFGWKSDAGRTGERGNNKRAEMWLTMREWLKTGAIPDEDLLGEELMGPRYGYDAGNAVTIEKKSDMKKRGVPSPDVADALALTFSYPVMGREEDEEEEVHAGRNATTGW